MIRRDITKGTWHYVYDQGEHERLRRYGYGTPVTKDRTEGMPTT